MALRTFDQKYALGTLAKTRKDPVRFMMHVAGRVMRRLPKSVEKSAAMDYAAARKGFFFSGILKDIASLRGVNFWRKTRNPRRAVDHAHRI